MRQNVLHHYLASWWAPSALFLTLVGCCWLSTGVMDWVSYVCLLLSLIALLGIFVASITNFLQKRWLAGILNLLGFLLFGYYVGLMVLWFLFIVTLLGPP